VVNLPGHVQDLLEVQVFEGEVHLDDTSGLDTGPEDVLLGGLVLLCSKAIEIIQETKNNFFYINVSRMINFLFLPKTYYLAESFS
jgi:hypothetical protein